MYNLRVYLKGVSKVKDPSKIVNGKKIPGKTKLFNTLSFRKIAKKDIQHILNGVAGKGNGEIVKYEIRLEK
tara:strand:+ start:136 stop:348 length:213 start_codon:yes stop_codon:yes gene_type:complete